MAMDWFVGCGAGGGSGTAIFGLADNAMMIFSVVPARSRQVQQIVYALVLHVAKLLCGVVLVTVRRTFPEGYVECIWNLANASIVI